MALRGSEKAIALAFLVTFIAGASELVAARFTGWVIDGIAGDPTGAFWQPFWPLILFGLVFFLIIRPVIFAYDAGVTSLMLGPNVFPQVLSRLNRHTLGHSMKFFENDFAGRISQKALQTARALLDVVIEVTDVGVYSLAMFAGALFLIGQIDVRLLGVFVIWGVLYGWTLWYFIPRVRKLAEKRAGARTMVTARSLTR